jgi:hypothetical protein
LSAALHAPRSPPFWLYTNNTATTSASLALLL